MPAGLAPVTRASALPAAPLTLVADVTWPGLLLGPESLRRPHPDGRPECRGAARHDRDSRRYW